MLLPHDVVRDAARIARALADLATRTGEPDHAAYYEQVAVEADDRADYLLFLLTRLAHPISASMGVFCVGDRVRLRLTRHCGRFHATDTNGRIGLISGVVTTDLLARDNATVTDSHDILTLDDFGDHIYSIAFTGVDPLDGGFCSVGEMEHLPAWALNAFPLPIRK